MDITEFCCLHGEMTRDIQSVTQDWHVAEFQEMLYAACEHDRHTVSAGESLRSAVGDAVILADAVHGGGMLDTIPPAVQDAFVKLMHVTPGDYSEMRRELLSHLRADDGGFRSFSDPGVLGFISKLKGQIGENLFAEHVGGAARLAVSGSQEGWDVAVRQGDGVFQYVQVKLHASASGVVRHMIDVRNKALGGAIEGIDGETVNKVLFAVPDDIRADVLRLAGKHDGLAELVYEKSIPISARNAGVLVTEGMSNVGPDQLKHFFGQLLCGVTTAGAIHAVVNGFLWHKESKELATAIADTVTDTLVSTVGIGIGLVADSLIRTALFSGAVGIGARMFISRVARSRWNFAEFLQKSLAEAEARIAVLQQLPPEVATASKQVSHRSLAQRVGWVEPYQPERIQTTGSC